MLYFMSILTFCPVETDTFVSALTLDTLSKSDAFSYSMSCCLSPLLR